uniref:NADH:ubiquinone reductase (H(+)-translocating) n=1 Tax=Vorticeros sp. n. MW-2019 TaxID=2544881 RepID=A0AA49X870_9PLAT|nr:NADH dehydrogenase subunit 5 [Vorticeros sp. n. MW-2019]
MNIYYFELSNVVFNLNLTLISDYISVVFGGLLLLIVGSVYLFGGFYMFNDSNVVRFFFILSMFVVSMVVLIYCPHIIFVFVGYDGLGVISFILVVYYGSSSSWVAGIKTFLINRLGDGLFLFGLIYLLIGNLEILNISYSVSSVVLICLILGWSTKSAQYPFLSWLPAAMAAPTPVSALVHSSTLVTAGVYLLIRFSNNLGNSFQILLISLGLITLFVASFCACVEMDVKKIVAYSTLSQLGLMVYTLGNGLIGLCYFHLINHAIFKALMFIVVGYMIMSNFHLQDLRLLNSLLLNNYFLFIIISVSVMALSGFPFLVGFYSKDVIIESYFMINILQQMLFLGSLIFTSFYGLRLIIYLGNLNYPINITTINISFSYLSCLGLTTLILFWGNWFSWWYQNNSFISFNFKMGVLFLIISGAVWMLVSGRLLVGLNTRWLYINLSYINNLNTHNLVKVFSNVGTYYSNYLDLGILKAINSFVDINNVSVNLNSQLKFLGEFNLSYWVWISLVLVLSVLLL